MTPYKQTLKSLIRLIFVLLVLFGFFYYLNVYHDDELKKLYLKFDVWGVTETGRNELQRIEAIDALQDQDVPSVQQEALKNKTVFLGATSEMVTLALGKPTKQQELNNLSQQVWIYNFDDYSRPTYLYFEKKNNKWVLTKAEKASR